MKILFYIDCMGLGGAQRVMKNLIEGYIDDGDQVILITDYASVEGVKEYEIPANVNRVSLNISCKSAKHPGNVERIALLRRILIEERPDVAVSFLGPPNYRMMVASIGLKHKVVVSVRNDPKMEYGVGIRKILANALFCLSDGVVFQTKEAAQYFSKSIQKKSQIILNPVAPSFFQKTWKGSGREIIAVGRLQPQKNPQLLLNAFIMIADQIPEYSLGFYGDGELSESLKAEAEKHGLSERVRFYGRRMDIPDVLENAVLFVLSSDYEGMPNALMEAMAVGLPVISTDCPCGGPRELLSGDQGVLVRCGDASMLSDAILHIIKDHELQLRLSRNAAECAKEFSQEIIFKQWAEFLSAGL